MEKNDLFDKQKILFKVTFFYETIEKNVEHEKQICCVKQKNDHMVSLHWEF